MQDGNDAAAAAVAAPFAYRYRFVNVECDEAAGALCGWAEKMLPSNPCHLPCCWNCCGAPMRW